MLCGEQLATVHPHDVNEPVIWSGALPSFLSHTLMECMESVLGNSPRLILASSKLATASGVPFNDAHPPQDAFISVNRINAATLATFIDRLLFKGVQILNL